MSNKRSNSGRSYNPGDGQVADAILLHRVRSGMNDCFLRYLFADGGVHNLFLHNGMRSSQRLGESMGAIGIAEIRWIQGADRSGGRFVQVERFSNAPWSGTLRGYSVMSVLLEITRSLLPPGGREPETADFLFSLLTNALVPEIYHIYQLFILGGYLAADDWCELCGCAMWSAGHPLAVDANAARLKCGRGEESEGKGLAQYIESITGRPSKFLSLVTTQHR